MCRKYQQPNDWIMSYSHLKPKDRERKLTLEYARANFELARYEANTRNCDCYDCRRKRPGLLQRIFG